MLDSWNKIRAEDPAPCLLCLSPQARGPLNRPRAGSRLALPFLDQRGSDSAPVGTWFRGVWLQDVPDGQVDI